MGGPLPTVGNTVHSMPFHFKITPFSERPAHTQQQCIADSGKGEGIQRVPWNPSFGRASVSAISKYSNRAVTLIWAFIIMQQSVVYQYNLIRVDEKPIGGLVLR